MSPGEELAGNRSASCDSQKQDAPKETGLQAEGRVTDRSSRSKEEKSSSRRSKPLEFWKSFTLSGGQPQSRQRIVGMKESSRRTAISRGRAFGSNRATASTISSGFPPSLHRANLSPAAGFRRFDSACRQRRLDSVSHCHAEDRGPVLRSCRQRLPQACGRRQERVVRRRWPRPRMPSRGDGAPVCRRPRRPGHACAVAGKDWRP